MTRRRTRAIFIEYQQRFYGRFRDREILRNWTAKTDQQREAWLLDYEQTQGIAHDVRAAQHDADAAQAQVNERLANLNNGLDPDTFVSLLRRFDRAKSAWERLSDLRNQQLHLWTQFIHTEQQQPRWTQEAQQHAYDEAADLRNEMQHAQNGFHRDEALRDFPPIPLDENNKYKMPTYWLHPERRTYVKRERYRADVADGTAGLNQQGHGRWEPWAAGGGNLSEGHVWVKTDHHNTVIDRLFRKDAYLGEDQWIDPRCFEGDIRDPGQKLHWELACHDAMMDTNIDTVVRLRRRFPRGLVDEFSRSYKLYTNWCPNGDLLSLIDRHNRHGRLIPEPMIWHVAECLVECGIAMEQGDILMDDWQEIVHRDLKPANVFLGTQDDHRYHDYPMVLVGDFGLAFKTSKDDPNNPSWFNHGWGTSGFQAPEQFKWCDLADLSPINEWRLNAKTNVYGIGIILRCLVLNETFAEFPAPQPMWLGVGDQDTTLNFPPGGPAAHYNNTLKNLISDCLRFQPEQRPTFTNLQQRITSHTHTPGITDFSLGMRDNSAGLQVRLAQSVLFPVDEYRIGMQRHELP